VRRTYHIQALFFAGLLLEAACGGTDNVIGFYDWDANVAPCSKPGDIVVVEGGIATCQCTPDGTWDCNPRVTDACASTSFHSCDDGSDDSFVPVASTDAAYEPDALLGGPVDGPRIEDVGVEDEIADANIVDADDATMHDAEYSDASLDAAPDAWGAADAYVDASLDTSIVDANRWDDAAGDAGDGSTDADNDASNAADGSADRDSDSSSTCGCLHHNYIWQGPNWRSTLLVCRSYAYVDWTDASRCASQPDCDIDGVDMLVDSDNDAGVQSALEAGTTFPSSISDLVTSVQVDERSFQFVPCPTGTICAAVPGGVSNLTYALLGIQLTQRTSPACSNSATPDASATDAGSE